MKNKKSGFKATDAEISAKTYGEWSNDRIAELVRDLSGKLKSKRVDGWEGIISMASLLTLITLMEDCNCGTFETELKDVYVNGNDELRKSWKVTISQI